MYVLHNSGLFEYNFSLEVLFVGYIDVNVAENK